MTRRARHLGEFELGRAGEAEIEAIGRLPGLSDVTVRALPRELADDGRWCLVARRGGQVVAYLGALRQLDDVHVTDVAVAPVWRRQGVGAALLAELCRRVEDVGVAAITLEVRPSNAPALALYRRLGFVVEGRRRGYYRDGEDALILWRRARTCGGEES